MRKVILGVLCVRLVKFHTFLCANICLCVGACVLYS